MTEMNEIIIEPFSLEYQAQVADLILNIQNNEFDIPITLEQQNDLLNIPTFYQTSPGNFWIAIANDQVVGTIGLLSIKNDLVALRKMFVHSEFRGKQFQIAQTLLDTAIRWCQAQKIQTIYLGTTEKFVAAHRFYEKNGFIEIPKQSLPQTFPVMDVDVKFYKLSLN